MAYEVLVDVLQVVDPEGGVYQGTDQPKKVDEYHKGDTVDIKDELRAKQLLEGGAIGEVKKEAKEPKASS